MDNVNRYLKIAKDAVIEPEAEINDRIIDSISSVDEKDRKRILDDRFMEFFKKNNSRLYLTLQKLRSHPGFFTFLFILSVVIISVLAYFINSVLCREKE
jgi:hypothetical protein